MKVQRIDTLCNNCGNLIPDPTDDNVVPILVEGKEYVSDWCDTCRTALKLKLGGEVAELTCGWNGCDFVAKTIRGLATHRSRLKHQ